MKALFLRKRSYSPGVTEGDQQVQTQDNIKDVSNWDNGYSDGGERVLPHDSKASKEFPQLQHTPNKIQPRGRN